MMYPRLQMKEPYSFRYNRIDNVDIQSYMNSYGFISGLTAAWKDYVQQMFEHFDAGLAANEGLEATLKELMPNRRRLTVSRKAAGAYLIECVEGGAYAFLTVGDDDSLILSICNRDASAAGEGIDLGCYDAEDAASFIAHAFGAYRNLNNRFVKAFINS